jgi:hypothetical protein
MDVRTASGLYRSRQSHSVCRKPENGGRKPCSYIFVIVKVPFPVHPPLPVRVQVPEMVLPLAVPFSASVLPEGSPDRTFMPKLPLTFPLKFPLSVNEPVSVSAETKQGEFVVNLKLVTLSDPSLFSANEVPKAKTVVLPPLTSVAFHVPLILDALELLEPQPTSASPIKSTNTMPNCFIKSFPRVQSPKGAQS